MTRIHQFLHNLSRASLLLALSTAALAQPRVTPVPDVVRMERPSEQEIARVEEACSHFRA